MLDSPIIEVAIGLTFVFLVLSFFATAVVEGLIEWRQWRGRLLHAKLRSLFGDEITQHFYLERRVADLASGEAPAGMLEKLNYYISLAPWPGIFTSTSKNEAQKLAARLGAARLPSHIPDEVFADILIDWLQGTGLPEGLRPGSAQLTPIPVRLAELWQRINRRSNGDRTRIHLELVAWFNQCAERTTGEFKRRIRLALILVGATLVVALNADTLRIARTLYNEPQLRSQIVAAAEHVERSCEHGQEDCEALREAVTSSFRATIDGSSAELIGWSSSESGDLGMQIVGWLLTVLAIGLGADFWFGALKKILSLRTAKSGAEVGQGSTASGNASELKIAEQRVESDPSPLNIEDPIVAGLKGFQAYGFAESNVRAFWLAHFASLAYFSEHELKNSLLAKNHDLTIELIDEEGTQVFVFRGRDICVVAFRGTEKALEDFMTDADAKQVPTTWGPAGSMVHNGFNKALEVVWKRLTTKLGAAECPIWLTGHSLGGALAMLAAIRLNIEASERTIAGVYTFGQPRVLGVEWANSCPAHVSQRVFRYVNSSDIVPCVPPRALMNYEHIGQLRYFDAAGSLHKDRTLWERVAEQLTPAIGQISSGSVKWKELASAHARQRVSDHGISRYLECLERLDAVRALWRQP